MFPAFVVTAVMAVTAIPGATPPPDAVPGDGLGLSPVRTRGASSASPPPQAPPADPTGTPWALPVVGVAGAALLARRREPTAVPTPAIVVFVPGHGSEASGTFDELIAALGLSADQVVHFDYRWAAPGLSHVDASRHVPTGAAADVLHHVLVGVAAGERPVYLIGHSKGGAVLAELLARWDAAPETAVGGVSGAALLDPPIAAGLDGFLQSIGRRWGPVPDDGGYDPVRCRLGCVDTRAFLGRRAGVSVVVVRNPDAGITSFDDEPPGLRVLDLDDDGAVPAIDNWRLGPVSVAERIGEAHRSVLEHPAVAECVLAEMHGTCEWSAGRDVSGPAVKRPGRRRSRRR